MKEMIQKVREDKGGFTLAELLVVVAIVAVLVAIAIPVFTSSLDKANAQTDAANIRAGYASVMVEVLNDNPAKGTVTYGLNTDGSVVKDTAGSYACKGDSTKLETGEQIGGTDVTWKKSQAVTYTYTKATNKITIAAK